MSTTPITRDDLEAKFRELQTEVDDTVEQSMGVAVVAGVAVVVGIVLVAFALGRRRGRKRTTVVEIRRI
jgi:ABC-type spermidine/putrescine transport system permease subunit II